MSSDPFAPANDSGLKPYVIETRWFAHDSRRLEYAASLNDAKARWGWTRQQHTFIKVRRARVSDVEAISWAG